MHWRIWSQHDCPDVASFVMNRREFSVGGVILGFNPRGYETRGRYDGGMGLFSPQAQDVLVEHVTRMAASVRNN